VYDAKLQLMLELQFEKRE